MMQSEQRSWHRAIAAHVLATAQRSYPSSIGQGGWPNDARAQAITRGAVTPTTTAGFPTFNPVVAYRSLAPNSAALALFELGLALDLTGTSTIRIPSVAGCRCNRFLLAKVCRRLSCNGRLL